MNNTASRPDKRALRGCVVALLVAACPAGAKPRVALPDMAATQRGQLADSASADTLSNEIGALDAKVFDAYNRCDLSAFSNYFDPKVAFYHDTGGATFERDAMVDGVRRNICGKVKRQLVPASLRIYPIKDYGAIEEGEHRFCELATGRCEGLAKFVMIWTKQSGAWRITTVLSYGHRAATPEEQREAAGR